MKKALFITVIASVMFASCMVNTPEESIEPKSKSAVAEAPLQRVAPAQEAQTEEVGPESEETKVVSWGNFYKRVRQKGQEKYGCKIPWNYLAKDAGIMTGSWMVSADSCKRTPPTEEEIRKIADALGTSYEWLLYGEE